MRTIFLLFFIFFSFLKADIELYFQEDEIEYIPKQIISLEFGLGNIDRSYTKMIDEKMHISTKDQSFVGFKLGAEDIGLRLFISYRQLWIDSVNTYSYGVELDSLINLDSNIWKLFYGIQVGVIKYQLTEIESEGDDDFKKVSTPYYGIQGGIISKMTPNIDVELGIRYALTNFNSNYLDTSYIIDEIVTYYLGVNYKY